MFGVCMKSGDEFFVGSILVWFGLGLLEFEVIGDDFLLVGVNNVSVVNGKKWKKK